MLEPSVAQALIGGLFAGGGGSVLVILIRGAFKWASGKQGREVVKRKSYEQRIADAEAERDAEARTRRKLEEYASRLRRDMYEAGLEPEAWPPESKEIQP